MRNILLLSPHPDDIELAMGATVLKLARQYRLFIYCFNTCGIIEEFNDSMAIINPNEFRVDYNLMLRKFNKERQYILGMLLNIKVDFNPDVVFMPNLSDCHQDHRVIAEEAYRAFKYCDLISYIHPQNCTEIKPNYFIEITEQELNDKIKLLSVYKSQSERNYMNPESVKGVALFYGIMSNKRYAEAFEIIRKFE